MGKPTCRHRFTIFNYIFFWSQQEQKGYIYFLSIFPFYNEERTNISKNNLPLCIHTNAFTVYVISVKLKRDEVRGRVQNTTCKWKYMYRNYLSLCLSRSLSSYLCLLLLNCLINKKKIRIIIWLQYNESVRWKWYGMAELVCFTRPNGLLRKSISKNEEVNTMVGTFTLH